MTKAQVQNGHNYLMNHSSGYVPVRIHFAKPTKMYGSRDGSNKTMTHWVATNLKTGRQIEIKSAIKLIRELDAHEVPAA